MPKNAVMAFCSFYKQNLGSTFKNQKNNLDNENVLTKLRFRFKKEAYDDKYEKKFDIVLHPNSVFLIPLFTNRIYTHEIIPSNLPVDKLPTRMGYVIRCSNTNSVYKDGKTFIVKDNKYIELEEPTDEGIKELKNLYYKENRTIEKVFYDKFYFSLNRGDYTKPIV